MAPRGTIDAERGEGSVGAQVGRFVLAGAVVLGIVGLSTSIASRRLGEREAVTDARDSAVIRAIGLVEPALEAGVLTGDPAAIARLDELVRSDVLDDSLVRVKLWTRDGRIIYSDETRLIGTDWDLGADERAALASGAIEAEVSDLAKPENEFEQPFGKLLEVYLPIQARDGTTVLFEAYYRYSLVERTGGRLWRSFAPIALGSLVLLQLVQIPLALSLARRLRQRHLEREGLLRRAIEASDIERRRIASDLHDGAVQHLAGMAYALSAEVRAGPDAQARALMETTADGIRDTIGSLRSLIGDIYPPDFAQVPFESAAADLLARAAEGGIDTELDTAGLVAPPPLAAAKVLYRVAQEAVRNVLAHAQSTTLLLRVTSTPAGWALEVIDNGRGFDPADLEHRRVEGHVGLAALRGMVEDSGGTLTIKSSHAAGTTVHVEVTGR